MVKNRIAVHEVYESVADCAKIRREFENILEFLGNKNLDQTAYCDDASGELTICFKDGQCLSYDRGMKDGSVHLRDFIQKLESFFHEN